MSTPGTTDFHAVLFAWKLSTSASGSTFGRIANGLSGAQVDLNPHQIDAAIFALESPLSRGTLLADEVGLGKTIEAGIVLSQLWASGNRRLLLITPASIRKQWRSELADKFFLPSAIIDTTSYTLARKSGTPNPFLADDVILIASYQFAAGKSEQLKLIPWDLVVFDEAHRLRNVYKKDNKYAKALRTSLAAPRKLLLTATPLQNSLMELYGLSTFIDPLVFGSEDSFREKYLTTLTSALLDDLKRRLSPFCHRTLRKQVTEYISYTNRTCMTEIFTPYEDEDLLYGAVSGWLQSKNLYAFKKGSRALVTLVLRKVLASSSFALAGSMDRILARLEAKRSKMSRADALIRDFSSDLEGLREDQEDSDDDPDDDDSDGIDSSSDDDLEDPPDIDEEIESVRYFRDMARAITRNAKGDHLAVALKRGFDALASRGAPRKAIIFTESRRTQRYLYGLLESSEYKGQVVLFNGQNDDHMSNEIYRLWLSRNKGSDKISGSPTADKRAAILEYFRDSASIMIATEAAGEGVNLQFCSLVVNYDLPWNPQRIEQRIGRCHRYGQKFDVTVLNFINDHNAADQRVYELLSDKFKLFSGVFGVSDEVLGSIQSGIDFERRVLSIYQTCRTTDQINAAFDRLTHELEPQINAALSSAKSTILDKLDDEVASKLRLREREALDFISIQERDLYRLTKHIIGPRAHWHDSSFAFSLDSPPDPTFPSGRYQIHPDSSTPAHVYRIQHPLAQHCITAAKALTPASAKLTFVYIGLPKMSRIESLVGSSGWLSISILTAASHAATDDLIIATVLLDDGSVLDPDIALQLFSCDAALASSSYRPPASLADEHEFALNATIQSLKDRNHRYFGEEFNKLELWATDLKNVLDKELSNLEQKMSEEMRASALSTTLEERLEHTRTFHRLERQRNDKRKKIFEAQDDISAKRDAHIADIEKSLQIEESSTLLFTIRFEIVGDKS
jgi:adenine-specific DNA-methyltransferase